MVAWNPVAVSKPDRPPQAWAVAHHGADLPGGTGYNVSIIAHPDSRFYSFTRGMVSGDHRHAHDAAATTWLQVTADIGIGSSGGPVLDDRGNVAGMSKPRGEGEVQMVFKDCVPAASILEPVKPAK